MDHYKNFILFGSIILLFFTNCITSKKEHNEQYYESLGDRYLVEFVDSIGHPRRDYYSKTQGNNLILQQIENKYKKEDTIYFAISTRSNARPIARASISISFKFNKTLDSIFSDVKVVPLKYSCINGVSTSYSGIYFEPVIESSSVIQTGKYYVLIRTEQWSDNGCDND